MGAFVATLKTLILILAIAGLSACAGSTTPMTSEDLQGAWEKQEQTLPPIHLQVTKDSSGLRARLRLSGIERIGRMTVEGSQLTLQFEGSSEPITAALRSKTEMQLWLGPGRHTYLLKKRT